MANFGTMATGTLNFGLFVLPMGDELNMSRGFIGWSQTARMLGGGLSGFILGRLLDRHGARALITAASITTALCMVGLAYVKNPWQFLLLFSLMGLIGLSAPGSLLTSVPIAKWFIRQRGKAMAVATTGLGVGGVAFMPITQGLIDEVGWRGAWLALALVSVALTVPLTALLLRRQPEDMGLSPDGGDTARPERPALASRRPRREEVQWTVGQAIRTKTFRRLTLFFGLLGLAAGGGSVHRLPYWVEKGFDPQLVSYAFSADAAGAALMALAAGFLVDRFPVKFVAMASCLGFAVSVGLMLVASNPFYLFSSVILFGLAVGANMIVTSFIWAHYYGRAFLGAIRGLALPVTLVTSGIGAPLAGYIYDAGGSYEPVWWTLMGLYVLAGLVILSAGAPRRPAEPEPA